MKKYFKKILLLFTILTLGALVAPTVLKAVDSEPVQAVKIRNQNEDLVVDLIQRLDGKTALAIDGEIQVNELNGQPSNGVTWFYIGTQTDNNGVGAAGDTVTMSISAALTPMDTVYPAVSVVTTVTAGMLAAAYPERALAQQICTDAAADSNFNAAWKCEVVKDHSTVFISSKLFNEVGWRSTCIPIQNCFDVVATGTTRVDVAHNDVRAHPLTTELSRSPNDPRKGTLSVEGSFIQQPGGTGDLLFKELIDGGTPSMIVDGSVTPVNFRIECDSIDDQYINILRIFFTCSGIKLTNWACSNSALTNGLLITIRSEGQDLVMLPIKTTSDLINKFAFGPAGPSGQARIDIQQGGDSMTASLSFVSAAIVKKCGTNGTGTDDYMEVRVRDNLTGASGGNLSEMESLVFGFKRTP